MKKIICIISILIVMLLILTGCSVNVNYEVKINKDGSGDICYVYGFTKDTFESLQTTPDNLLKSMKERAEQNEYLVEDYEDDEISGFKATKHLNNLAQDFSLKEAFGDEYINEANNENKKELLIDKTFFYTKIEQNTKIDLTSMEDYASINKLKYSIKLPVRVKSSNASNTSNNGKTLTWELIPGEINNIEFVGFGLSIWSILIIIAVIASIILCSTIFIKKNKVTK